MMILVLFFSLAAEAKKAYPNVFWTKGTVQDQRQMSDDKIKTSSLKKGDVLTEKAFIITGKSAQVLIDLDEHSSLTVFPESRVSMPVISWGEGEVTEIKIESGKIRYNCEKNCTRSLLTPLSNNVFSNGEYLLQYSPNSTYVELTVLHGMQEFHGLENENSVKLEAGQKVVFQGLRENDQIAYDVLLKGRKVARGKLAPIVKIPQDELQRIINENQIKKKVASQVKKKIIRSESQICEEPLGELNQCAWICQGNLKKLKTCDLSRGVKCIRTRCNANGQWEDPFELNSLQNPCELKPLVKACDY